MHSNYLNQIIIIKKGLDAKDIGIEYIVQVSFDDYYSNK
jgi:hypothetical protein